MEPQVPPMEPQLPPVEDGAPQRYFCHQCNTSCVPVDYLCPTCNEGFIEPIAISPLATPPRGFFPLLENLDLTSRTSTESGIPQATIPQSTIPQPGLTRQHILRHNPIRRGDRAGRQRVDGASTSLGGPGGLGGPIPLGGHSHRIHTSYVNPNTDDTTHNMFNGGRMRFVLGEEGQTDIPTLFSMIMSGLNTEQQPLAGNPGDYAWGPGGLDNIISQLIGQLDGQLGPPPAQEDKIESLPEVFIPQKHIEDKLDCTVCQEYFTSDVKVKQLPCNHFFHKDCITPWLSLHNSCPICRVSIDSEQSAGTPAGSGTLPQTQPGVRDELHEDDLD